MTERPSIFPPSFDPAKLLKYLVELALGGSVEPGPALREWLEAIGAAQAGDGESVIADEDWLACSLPAASADELLVRTFLRDPLYRLHLDLALAEVVATIGISSRWQRLEELLFGELAVLSPRILALVELARDNDGNWGIDCWRRLRPLPLDIAAILDERCWGIAGSPEELFPVLRTRYPAFASVPVFIQSSSSLVLRVVSAATAGEGVRVAGHGESELFDLAEKGVPLWWRHLGDGQIEVTLSSPCRVRGGQDSFSTHAFSRGVPINVRERSALLSGHAARPRASFWEIAEAETAGLAFVGASSRDAWPSDQDAASRGLPRAEDLENLVRSRRVEKGITDPADEALRRLSDHPLYGFWVQVLLVEALDRELGEETLLIAPPTHAIVEDIEGATHVYYQPRVDATRQLRPLLELGPLDEVMNRLAMSVNLRPVAALGDIAGSWPLSLALLARVGIVQTRHDRWALSTYSLDRLHGGGLMTGVIRRGRRFRERLHDVLEALWAERAKAAWEAKNG